MAAQIANFPVRVARPSIEIDGQRNATLTSAMQTLLVAESADGLAHAQLTVGNWGGPASGGFQYFDRRTLDFGKTLAVTLGDARLFEGRISALHATFPDGGTPQLAVFAEDRLQDLRMTRRTRSWADATLAGVLQRLAADHGLQVQLDLQGETYALLAQVNQSDLAFARELARREDAQVWVDGSTLHAAQRVRRTGAGVKLAWAGTLRAFDVCADLAQQRTALVAGGWSVADKQPDGYRADDAAVRAELNGLPSGAETLQAAFGERVDTLAHGAPANTGQARALAEASFRHGARRFVVGHGVAQTDAALRVGSKLSISGVGPLFEGDYTATDVRVRFDAAVGLRTEFSCDRPFIGRAA